MKCGFMKKFIQFITIVTGISILVGCVNSIENETPVKRGQLAYAAQYASSGNLVDVSLSSLYRFNYASGQIVNSYVKTDDAPISGYSSQGLMWRTIQTVPTGATPAPVRLYELFGVNNGIGDHMSSIFSGEGGYNGLSSPLGWVFNTPDPQMGLQPIKRYSKAWTDVNGYHIDHLTAKFNEVPAGYTYDGILGYGWPVYSAPGSFVRTVKGIIDIGTSKGWGGAIASLKWNGRELINRGPDISGINGGFNNGNGRLLQTAVFYATGNNPTEAGDMYGNGSPIIAYSPNYPAGSGKLTSRVNGLEFGWYNTPPVTRHTPMLTGTEFEKTVQIVDNNQINYEVKVRFGKNVAYDKGYPVVEGLTAHLVDQVFDFAVNYAYNYSTKKFTKYGTTYQANTPDAGVNYPVAGSVPSKVPLLLVATTLATNMTFAILPMSVGPYVNNASQLGTWPGVYRCETNRTDGSPEDVATLKLGWEERGFTTSATNSKGGVLKGETATLKYIVIVGTENQVLARAEALAPQVIIRPSF
jgi:hypothetical protein